MKLDILGTNGQSTGRSIELPSEVFGVEPNEHVLYLAVKQYNAHQRQGTHKSKERAEIAGSTKKLKRQKGTGTARAGSIKSPVFRGGGRMFGPRPRNYSISLNKKVNRLARISALSQKVAAGQVVIVEDFSMDAPKTKALTQILTSVANGGKRLLVTGELEQSVYLSGRNLPKDNVTTAREVNTYSILKADKVILTESSVSKLKEILIG